MGGETGCVDCLEGEGCGVYYLRAEGCGVGC